MILSDGKIRPGRVLKVENAVGIIKACVPGLFSDQDDPELLPPVYPFFTGSANNFSKVNVDEDVWVLFFEKNPYELFWFRKDNLAENLSDILDEKYTTVEVVCSKEADGGYAQLYFTDGSGWILRYDSSVVQIDKDGNILLDTGKAHRAISIDDNCISLGTKGGSAEPAILGDKMEQCINDIYNVLSTIKSSAEVNPYTFLLGTAMKGPLAKLDKSRSKIKSEHVTLD